MTKAGDNHDKPTKKAGRTGRLAAALRQNLRRRKAQERQRGTAAEPQKPRGEPKNPPSEP